MSGKSGRSGRKALPINDHVLKGTYRKDRHGPLPEGGKEAILRHLTPENGDISPPEHLSGEAKAWWRKVTAQYDLENHHVALLQLSAEAWDQCQAARRVIAEHCAVFSDRFGTPRPRPEVGIAHDAALRFAKLVGQIGLDAATDAPETPTVALASIRSRDRQGGHHATA